MREAVHRNEEVVLVDLPDRLTQGVAVCGLSHGFWKDLLNLLVLPMEGDPDANGMGFH